VTIQVQDGNLDTGRAELGNLIKPSDTAIKNISDSEKFCEDQGVITFGQLKKIVKTATKKRLTQHIGEGTYKATLRLLPLALPQFVIIGFVGSIIRASNKIFRPTLEDTQSYKKWWGKLSLKIFNAVEGELNINDPLFRVFFISDGLMTMMNNKDRIKFARYLLGIISKIPETDEVPKFYVENELRNWINQKYLLDPPLPSKIK
jgi:hypothetical protein